VLPSLADLVSAVTATEALASIYQIANALGLTTTAWQPLGMARTILSTMSQVVAATSSYISLVAQGGYATTAALMVDSNGNPITAWMDLVSSDNYGNTRNPAIQAAGDVAFANVSAVPYSIPVGGFKMKNPMSGATYSNTAVATIAPSGSPPTPQYSLVSMAADLAYPGSSGTFATGTPVLITGQPGVTAQALGTHGSATSLVGSDAETNAALLVRDLAKLGSIAPNGAESALIYVATTAPANLGPGAQAIIAITGPLSTPVTRAFDTVALHTGIVSLYVANDNGPCSSGDVAIVQALEQGLAVPTDMTLTVMPAIAAPIVVTATIYVSGAAGSISADASAAVAEVFAGVPIGGIVGSGSGEVPLSTIYTAISSASPFIVEIDLAAPAGNVSLSLGEVPVLDPSSTFTVVVVS
jgi:hypothetical protein